MPAQLDTVKKVGNLTMTELYRFGMVEIGPGFGERLRTVLDELHGSRNGNGRTKARREPPSCSSPTPTSPSSCA